MAKLQVPTENPQANLTPMNMRYNSYELAAGAKIGEVEQSQGASAVKAAAPMGGMEEAMGQDIARTGLQYSAQAFKAMQNTMYNIVQSNAAKTYNDAANEQIGNVTSPSDSGSTNYAKAKALSNTGGLGAGLDQTANAVIGQYSQGLTDPETKQRLANSIINQNNNKKVQASSAERSTQINLAGQALQQGIQSDITTGLQDSPENLGFYAHQSLNRIQASLQDGSISPEQAAVMGETVRKGLYFGSLQLQNQKDPNATGQLLATNDPASLNLTQVEYNQLKKQNVAALADQTKMAQTQYKAQNEINNASNRFTFGSLQDGIKQDKIGVTDIVNAYDQGQIDFNQYTQLSRTYQQANSSQNKTWANRQDISASINSGQVLANFTPQQIDDHYNNTLKSLSKDGTTNVSMDQKLDVVKHYQGPVPSFANELQYDVKSGDINKIKEAAYAFNQIQQSTPLVLSDIKDSHFMAFMSALTDQLKYSSATDSNTVKALHDSIYNLTDKQMKKHDNNFAAEPDFNSDNIKTTIANMYSGGNPWYRGADSVPDDIVHELTPLFREAYLQTGDAQSAISTVMNQTKALYGHSAVNDTSSIPGLSSIGLGSGSIMAVPPEMAYAGKATSDQIRQDINKDVTGLIPKGMDPSNVLVGSDDRTINEFRNHQSPSYYLYYNGPDGNPVMLGKRWQMDSNVKPNPSTFANVSSVMGPQENTKAVGAILSTTKGFGSSPILDNDFIKKVGQESQLNQIVSHYPGDINQRPVILSALNSMIGADKQPWRIGESMKLINSVLLNNSAPETYLKFGTSTSSPKPGDIVVSKTSAGLFGGVQNINGIPMVKVVSMQDHNLAVNLVSQEDIRGYRSLPTPENFYQQDTPISEHPNIPRFDIYGNNNGIARIPTGTESFNPYNMTTSIAPQNTNTKTIYDVNTNSMVPENSNFESQLSNTINTSKTGQTEIEKEIQDQSQANQPGWNNNNTSVQQPTQSTQTNQSQQFNNPWTNESTLRQTKDNMPSATNDPNLVDYGTDPKTKGTMFKVVDSSTPGELVVAAKNGLNAILDTSAFKGKDIKVVELHGTKAQIIVDGRQETVSLKWENPTEVESEQKSPQQPITAQVQNIPAETGPSTSNTIKENPIGNNPTGVSESVQRSSGHRGHRGKRRG